MRELRYVGPGEDVAHLVVETADGEEQFSLPITDALREATQSDLPRLGNIQSDPIQMSLRPREIQVRVRAGETPQAIADQAGIAIERVLRFAGPVLDERARVTDEARRARARRGTVEGQLAPFGELVDSRFAAHGIDPAHVNWDSYRREDGQWVVSASWHGGEAERVARWAFSLGQRLITPMDETAADLLSDRPIRPIVQIVSDGEPGPMSSGTGSLSAVSSEQLTGPMPAVRGEDVFDQDAATRGPFLLDLGGSRLAAEVDPTSTGSWSLRDAAPPDGPAVSLPPPGSDGWTGQVPPLPLHLADPVPGAHYPVPPETDEQRAERARIPSWDDILLGVRRKND